jgi:hypothetical protein
MWRFTENEEDNVIYAWMRLVLDSSHQNIRIIKKEAFSGEANIE